MVDSSHKGREFPPYSFVIERGKLNEFLLAIGDENPAYRTDDPPLPPTFATVFAFWGGMNLEYLLGQIGVEIWNVLHGEQEFEYLAPLHIGDTITGRVQIADVYAKAGMNFVEIVTHYSNQSNVSVLKDRALIIVRG